MPVTAVITALPPSTSSALTIRLVRSAKQKNTCASAPCLRACKLGSTQQTAPNSRQVIALIMTVSNEAIMGALRTMWARVPQRARMISSMVCAVGALRLISMARMPNSRIWIVAPAAYLHGCVMHMDPVRMLRFASMATAQRGECNLLMLLVAWMSTQTGYEWSRPHQKGPLMPYLYATLQLCSRVAALQLHCRLRLALRL